MMYINTELTSKVKDIQDSLDFLRAYIPTQPMIKRVYIFGSVAEGLEHDGSDIDIAVVADDMMGLLMQAEWWLKISLDCPVNVDYTVREEQDVHNWETIDNWESRILFYERNTKDLY